MTRIANIRSSIRRREAKRRNSIIFSFKDELRWEDFYRWTIFQTDFWLFLKKEELSVLGGVMRLTIFRYSDDAYRVIEVGYLSIHVARGRIFVGVGECMKNRFFRVM